MMVSFFIDDNLIHSSNNNNKIIYICMYVCCNIKRFFWLFKCRIVSNNVFYGLLTRCIDHHQKLIADNSQKLWIKRLVVKGSTRKSPTAQIYEILIHSFKKVVIIRLYWFMNSAFVSERKYLNVALLFRQ